MAAKKTAAFDAAVSIEVVSAKTAENFRTFTDAARGQYETALKSFNEKAEKFRAEAQTSFEATREGFETAGEKLRVANTDAIAQAQSEVSDAVAFANEIARAKSVTDAIEMQRDYLTKLFNARVEGARAYAEASADATRALFEPMNKSFTSAFAFAPSFETFFPFSSK